MAPRQRPDPYAAYNFEVIVNNISSDGKSAGGSFTSFTKSSRFMVSLERDRYPTICSSRQPSRMRMVSSTPFSCRRAATMADGVSEGDRS